MSRHPAIDEVGRDDGMTLVELILYSALSVLLLTVLASVFIMSWQADAATRRRDTATGAAHIITNSIQTSFRNASDFRLDGSLLRARVATGASGWECQAWRLANPKTISGKEWYELQYNRSAAAVDDASVGWSNLLDGLSGGDGLGVLVQGIPTEDEPFGKTGSLLTLHMKVVVVDLSNPRLDASVSVAGDAAARAWGEGSPTSCW